VKNNTVNKYANSENLNYKPKRDRSFIFIVLTVICFFIGCGLCVGFYSVTLIDIVNLSKFLAAFAVFGFLIPLKFYRLWFHFIKYEVILFNIMGIAPILTGLLLVINYTFSTNPKTHEFKIEKIYLEGEENYKSVGVVLEENFFSGEPKIVELTDFDPALILGKDNFFKVTISEGYFGFDVIKERLIIN
jgi:hypothetical protein